MHRISYTPITDLPKQVRDALDSLIPDSGDAFTYARVAVDRENAWGALRRLAYSASLVAVRIDINRVVRARMTKNKWNEEMRQVTFARRKDPGAEAALAALDWEDLEVTSGELAGAVLTMHGSGSSWIQPAGSRTRIGPIPAAVPVADYIRQHPRTRRPR